MSNADTNIPTPRTDAALTKAELILHPYAKPFAGWNLARQLERELAQANRKLERELEHSRKRVEAYKSELAAAVRYADALVVELDKGASQDE